MIDFEMGSAIDDTLPDTSNRTSDQKGSADDADWVRLQSVDGFSYLVRRKVSQASGTIRNMLDPTGGYAEANSLICEIRERGMIVEKLVEYMCFKTYYDNVGRKEEIPVNEMIERLPPELALEILSAADYHDM